MVRWHYHLFIEQKIYGKNDNTIKRTVEGERALKNNSDPIVPIAGTSATFLEREIIDSNPIVVKEDKNYVKGKNIQKVLFTRELSWRILSF